MTPEEALGWLEQVDARVYRGPLRRRDKETWVAVVRAPADAPRRPKLIVALGESLVEAAIAAERQWRAIWSCLGPVH